MKPNIDPKKDYNLTEIVEQQLMGAGKTYFVCKNIITEEVWLPARKRILNAVKIGTGRRSVYLVKGTNLIKYLQKQ